MPPQRSQNSFAAVHELVPTEMTNDVIKNILSTISYFIKNINPTSLNINTKYYYVGDSLSARDPRLRTFGTIAVVDLYNMRITEKKSPLHENKKDENTTS